MFKSIVDKRKHIRTPYSFYNYIIVVGNILKINLLIVLEKEGLVLVGEVT